MKSLPPELLHLIFFLLVKRDQLRCMTVCRQWYDIIQRDFLLRSICIYHFNQLTNLLERVKRDPVSGTKVEIIKLYITFGSAFLRKVLIQSFPKLREFTLIEPSGTFSGMFWHETIPDHPWCNSIETIIENNSNLFAMSVLRSGLCKNLTYLSIQNGDENVLSELIQRLPNAPALKKLYLSRYSIGLEDIELLHQTSPFLTTFSLEDFSFDDSFFPLNIKPATLVTEFICDGFEYRNENIRSHNRFLQYVCQKYTQLEKLILQICTFNVLEAHEVQTVAEQKQIIRSHLVTLGHRLKSLSILYTPTTGDFSTRFDLNILDECGYQIKRLSLLSVFDFSLLKQLADTTQVHYIQSLGIERLGFDTRDDISLEWLRQFTALKHLKLDFDTYSFYQELSQINLTHLLDLLSATKLETLEVWSITLDFDDSIIGSSCSSYTSLKQLTLGNTALKQGIDIALSQVFTELRYLELNDCAFHAKTLNLPVSALFHLKIIKRYSGHDFYVLVTTLDNDQHRFYTAISKEIRYYQPIPLTRAEKCFGREDYPFGYTTLPFKPYNHLTDTPMITIICKSLWCFAMEN